MAGGFLHQEPGEAKYTPTSLAQQGMLGSKLHAAPSGTVWTVGSHVQTAFSIRANHGGGYSFRLCPVSENLTEACFQETPLAFVPGKQMLRWANGTELAINGTYTTVGTHPPMSSWAMNPLPYSNAGSGPQFSPPCHEKTGSPPPLPDQCTLQQEGPLEGLDKCTTSYCSTKDYAFTANNVSVDECAARCRAVNCTCFDFNPASTGSHPFEHCRVASVSGSGGNAVVPSNSNYTAYQLPDQSPPMPGQVTDGYCSGQFPYNVMVVDTVAVPTVPPGDYVLGFRWDCEKSAQVIRPACRFGPGIEHAPPLFFEQLPLTPTVFCGPAPSIVFLRSGRLAQT
jgi:hypothetical protein